MNIQYLLDAAEFLESHSSLPFDQSTFSSLGGGGGDAVSTSGSQVSGQSSPSGSFSVHREPKIARRFKGKTARENHNALEKGRRAYLRDCFTHLRRAIEIEDPKCSNLAVLRGAIRCIQSLKRKEKNLEAETATLARRKIELQQRIGELKRELSATNPDASFDVNLWLKMHVKAYDGGDYAGFDDASRASGGGTSGDGKNDNDEVATTSTVSIDDNSKEPIYSDEEDIGNARAAAAARQPPPPSQQPLINFVLPPKDATLEQTRAGAAFVDAANTDTVLMSRNASVLNVVEATAETESVSPQRLAYVTADGLIIASDHELVRQGTNIILVQTSNLPS